jgi:hypothetical protein
MVSRRPRKQAAPRAVDKPQQIIQCKGTELKAHAGRKGGGENSVPNSLWEMMVLAIQCRDAGLIDGLAGVPAGGWETGTSTKRTASEQSEHLKSPIHSKLNCAVKLCKKKLHEKLK